LNIDPCSDGVSLHIVHEVKLKRRQQGFTKGLSTEGMLISMTEKWQMAIDNGWTVGEVFIDGL